MYSSQQKLAVGSLLAIIGAFGIVAGPMLEWSSFERPWSFLLGFVFGVSGGAGVAIGIHGLIDRRSGR
jgi:predicted ABC-type sugar transport system permease subunit